MMQPSFVPRSLHRITRQTANPLVAIALTCLGATGIAMTAVAPWVFVAPAEAAALTQWTFDPITYQLEIAVPPGVTPQYFLAAEPARIVIDLPNTDIGTVPTQQTYPTGAVRQIRVAQFQPGQTRIVLELAPGTVLAAGQVELKRSPASDRWILRPLLAAAPSVTATSPPTTASPPTTVVTPSMEFPATPSTPPSAVPAAPSEPSTNPSSALSDLPPLEPGALEIPVIPPSAPAPVAASTPSQSPSRPNAVAIDLALPAPQAAASAAPPRPPFTEFPAPTPLLRPSSPPSVPPLPAAAAPASAVPPPINAAPLSSTPQIIEFGQPLPIASSLMAASVLIPAGTILNLRYAGDEPIALSANDSRQEVLLLDREVRDATGNVVIPANSQVIGRFETSSKGSQFIVQAISWQDSNLLLKAESEPLQSDRQASGHPIIQPNQQMQVRLVEDVRR